MTRMSSPAAETSDRTGWQRYSGIFYPFFRFLARLGSRISADCPIFSIISDHPDRFVHLGRPNSSATPPKKSRVVGLWRQLLPAAGRRQAGSASRWHLFFAVCSRPAPVQKLEIVLASV